MTSPNCIIKRCRLVPRYECDQCNYTTYTKGCFTTHLKRHIKKYNLFCESCNEGFFNNTELTSHNIKLHGMEPFQCAICNDLFTSKGNLYSHIKSHDPGSTYMCEICGRTYRKKNSYKRHIVRNHMGQTAKAQCLVCERVLSSKEHLRRHMLTHTDERNWVCSTCGKRFLSKTYLTEHNRIHLGIRPYKCEICDKCFTQRGSLTIHKRSHTGERPYRCDYCCKGFVMGTLLRYHLRKCSEAKLSAGDDARSAEFAGCSAPSERDSTEEALENKSDPERGGKLPERATASAATEQISEDDARDADCEPSDRVIHHQTVQLSSVTMSPLNLGGKSEMAKVICSRQEPVSVITSSQLHSLNSFPMIPGAE